MNFVDYVNNRYQEVQMSMQDPPFSILKDGESNSLQFVLSVYRLLIKFMFIPKIITCFILVNLRVLKAPKPVFDELKEELEQAEKDKKDMKNIVSMLAKGPATQ